MLTVGAIGVRNHAARVISLVDASGLGRVKVAYHPDRLVDHPGATRHFEDLLACDAVLVLSPDPTHFGYLERLAAGRFGGYVFCEKPPVASVAELDALGRLDLDPGRLFADFNLRHGRFWAEVRAARADGRLGTPVHLAATSTVGLAFKAGYQSSWRADGARHPHGITLTRAVHYLDLAIALFGVPESIDYRPARVSGRGTAPDTCHIHLGFPGGGAATLFASYAAPLRVHLTVTGTDGIVDWRDDELAVAGPRDTFDERGFFAPPPRRIVHDFRAAGDDPFADSLRRAVTWFLEHAGARRPFPAADWETALATTRVLLAMAAP